MSNAYTSGFNAYWQPLLKSEERGRFLANILATCNIAYGSGTVVIGFALDASPRHTLALGVFGVLARLYVARVVDRLLPRAPR